MRIKTSTQKNEHITNPRSSRQDRHITSEFSEFSCTIEQCKKEIFCLLKNYFGVDFTHYKQSTIDRRIHRRMVFTQKETLESYTEFLLNNRAEPQALFDSMLIGVTNFFREPKTFLLLEQHVFPQLLNDKQNGAPTCIWVPGCSTGKEVYSIGIALYEFLERNGIKGQGTQILGTDINEKNIQHAKDAVYGEHIEAQVTSNRLRQYFSKNNHDYQVCGFIRDMCVFRRHDITFDAPPCNFNLVSCRNVLIYLHSCLQEKIVQSIHTALNHDGFLVLGESESIGKFGHLFDAVEAKGTVFKKKPPININHLGKQHPT